jgi:hypothetical protein
VVKMSLRILILPVLAVVSCDRPRATDQVHDTSIDSARLTTQVPEANSPPAPVEVPLTKPSLACTPVNFGPKDTLNLRMKIPHGDYLIASQPGDSLFYIIYPQLNVPTRKYSLIPSAEFMQMETLRLPADVKAVPWYAGRDTTVAPLFPRSGKYVLTMGEKLEGDNARAASCTVAFSKNQGR